MYEACLVADSYLCSPTPYSDTMAALNPNIQKLTKEEVSAWIQSKKNAGVVEGHTKQPTVILRNHLESAKGSIYKSTLVFFR